MGVGAGAGRQVGRACSGFSPPCWKSPSVQRACSASWCVEVTWALPFLGREMVEQVRTPVFSLSGAEN